MNIDLKQAASKKNIGFGLNKRGSKSKPATSKKRKKTSSIFNDADSDSSDVTVDDAGGGNANSSDARRQFNKDLAAEQTALRSRAEKAMKKASNTDATYGDYDAQYDSFSSGAAADRAKQLELAERQKPPAERKSRYIQNLLVASKNRDHEREIILERKIAREQAAEEMHHEYRDKDQFVTKSYKRKLEERQQWIDEDKVKSAKDEHNDVRKKVAGTAMMGLDWSKMENTSASSAIPEAKQIDKGSSNSNDRDRIENDTSSSYREINSDDDRKTSAVPNSRDSRTTRTHVQNEQPVGEEIEIDEELNEQNIRVLRLKNIFAARDRYLIRRQEVIEKTRAIKI
eukprot:28101_1